jgi:hypothetical protein
VKHCGDQPGEVRLIAIARRETECWEQIDYSPAKPPWSEAELVDWPDLSTDEARRLAVELAAMSPAFELTPDLVDTIARTNDGTFYHLILAFRDWRSQPNRQRITTEDVTNLQTDLASAWRHRRSLLFKRKPSLRYVYGALDLAQAIGLPDRQDLMVLLARSLRGSLSARIHAWVVAFWKWVQARLPGRRWLGRLNAATNRLLMRMIMGLQGVLLWPFRRLLGKRRWSGRWLRIWPRFSRIVLVLVAVVVVLVVYLLVVGMIILTLVSGK